MSEPDLPVNKWSPGKKQAFRFFFVFLCLHILLNPNGIIPHFYSLQRFYLQPVNRLVVWLSRNILHINISMQDVHHSANDTTFYYLFVLFIICTSCIGSVIWMLADKRSANYNKLYATLIIISRYYLAITWIAYGTIKIIRLQFPELTPVMLLQTYGDSLPRGLAWSFTGYSSGFNYFIGLTEYAIGLLLIFRKTSTIGNLIGLGAIANILAFNFFFHDNVKLLSIMVMIVTLFLLSKDINRLIAFFFMGKAINADDTSSFRFKENWKNTILLICKYGLFAGVLFVDLHSISQLAKQRGYGLKKPPLYGIYNVQTFIRNKDTIQPLTTDTTRWNKLIISSIPGKASIMLMNDSFRYFVFRPDTIKKTIQMYSETDTANKYTFIYNTFKDSTLMLSGKWRNDSLELHCHQYDINKFILNSDKFHWIIDQQPQLKR